MGNLKKLMLMFTFVAAIFGHQVAGQIPFITLNDGKLGVNFFGYHAAVGLGGNTGRGGAAGGLHAEAGTPFGQRAAAGLRGSTGEGAGGELYAGATAGGNVKAATGLGGVVSGGQQPLAFGRKYAVAGVPGSVSGVSEVRFANGGTEYVDIVKTADNRPPHQAEHIPPPPPPPERVNEVVKTKHIKKVVHHAPRPVFTKQVEINSRYGSDENVQQGHTGGVPAFNSFGSSFLDGFLSPQYQAPSAGGGGGVSLNKRVSYEDSGHTGSGGQFFQDIFNIPISTLSAVSKFLSNSAGSAGNIHVEKTYSHH